MAGKLMLQNGAETYRVEDTMTRMAAAFGAENAQSYVTPTGIWFSRSEGGPAKMARISARSTDLRKVTLVNSISREAVSGSLTLEEVRGRLEEVASSKLAYPAWIQLLAAALSSGCFLMMFQGTWADFLPAMAAGGAGFAASIFVHRFVPLKFFSELLAAFLIGLIAILSVRTGLGREIDKIVIGSVMPLVPGLLITNAVRDLMAGHLVSGLSKGAEAFLTAFAIGTGIAMVYSFF
ncbi:threonine/serine exporter family protein [Gorillibacterium sp. CAU 1737]|uniref:threonine/serine exporter family protein n=1 Tax=Gorillibacterium sp. CAU 1737 TaxID=3140362 RepID=UPI00326187E7